MIDCIVLVHVCPLNANSSDFILSINSMFIGWWKLNTYRSFIIKNAYCSTWLMLMCSFNTHPFVCTAHFLELSLILWMVLVLLFLIVYFYLFVLFSFSFEMPTNNSIVCVKISQFVHHLQFILMKKLKCITSDLTPMPAYLCSFIHHIIVCLFLFGCYSFTSLHYLNWCSFHKCIWMGYFLPESEWV